MKEESVAPRREYARIVLTLENVLVPADKLSPTPSFTDGLDSETEMDLRVLGCELIQTAGILLKLPQVSRNFSENKMASRDSFGIVWHILRFVRVNCMLLFLPF